jgi:hypothetical protein
MEVVGDEPAALTSTTEPARRPRLEVVRRWLARRHPERKALLVVACVCVLLLAVSLVLTIGERASDRDLLRAGTVYELSMQDGDLVGVYLTAMDSRALNFDVYASDLTCSLSDPDNREVAGNRGGRRRALDGWTRHTEVVSWQVATSGPHRLTCIDGVDRTYSIVLAKGEERWRTPIDPDGFLWLSVAIVGPIWCYVFMMSLFLRGASRLAARRRLTTEAPN